MEPEYVVSALFEDGPRQWRTEKVLEAHKIAVAYESMGATNVVTTAPNGSVFSVRDLYRAMSSGSLTDAQGS